MQQHGLLDHVAGEPRPHLVIDLALDAVEPATNIAAPVLRARLLAAIDTASGDILYTPSPGGPLIGGQYPAYPQPGQEVHVRVGPADIGGKPGTWYQRGLAAGSP